MKYKIIIEKKEANENFESEYKQWQDDSRCGMSRNMSDNMPLRNTITDALVCELTEEQFAAVKAEVFKAFN